jgi:hypothetical protein
MNTENSFLPPRFGDAEEAFSNEYIMEALGLNHRSPPPPNQKIATGDFPEDLADIIAKLTEEEATKLLSYIKAKP